MPLLVGRAREQALLRDQFGAALAGEGGLVLIGGEAGIGKTALVRAAGQEVMAGGGIVLTGRCDDLTITPPYGPWLDLSAAYRPGDGLPPLPVGLANAEAIAALGSSGALFAQVRDFLAAVAVARPLMVVLEDVHWADPASLDLLRFLVRQMPGLPLLLVVTYRSDELTRRHPLSAVLPALAREAQPVRIDLRPLDATDVRSLVAARYRLCEEGETRLAAYLHTRSEGNPFFTDELLRTLEGEQLLRPAGGGWVLGELGRVPVPPLLTQVIDGRVARLGAAAREPLAIAAVIGQEVALDLWAAVGGLAEEALLATVERAVEARLLEAGSDGTTVRFVHALTREALYEGLLPARRRGWHRTVAEALAAAPKADPDAVAYHFQQVGDARAEAWLVRAGDRAERTYAWVTAADRLEAALALTEAREADAGERGWLLYRAARLRRYAAPQQGIAALEEAERLAVAAGDSVLAAYAVSDRGLLRCFMWDVRRGLADMTAGLAALDALPDAERPSDIRLALGRDTLVLWLALAGRLDEARRLGERLVAQASVAPRSRERASHNDADASFGLAMVYANLGRPEEARRAFACARDQLLSIEHHTIVATIAVHELLWLVLPYHADDLAGRRRLADEAEEAWARAAGARAPVSLGAHLPLMLIEGNWAEARPLASAVYAAKDMPRWELAVLARAQGDADLAWSLVRDVLPAGPATEPGDSDFLFTLVLLRVAAFLSIDMGDLETARAWLEAHDRWLAWSGSVLGQADGHLAWGAYHRAAGDPARADHHAAKALARATQARQPLALLAAHRLRGELATDAGRPADADRHLHEAFALADACVALYERALTLLALAELRAATGQPEAALALVVDVRTICLPLGATPTLARADALAAQLGAMTPARTDPTGLTPRERDVLRLLVAGRSNREIAAALFISRHTATTHVSSVLHKFGVESRAAAVAYAYEHDLA